VNQSSVAKEGIHGAVLRHKIKAHDRYTCTGYIGMNITREIFPLR
jgi:hypothetical protein